MKKYCVRCGLLKGTAVGRNPLCAECQPFVELSDSDLLKSEAAFELQMRRMARAHKRKCTSCGKPNPPTRYYRCDDCVKPHDRRTEDEFDSFAAYQRVIDGEPLTAPPLTFKQQFEAEYHTRMASK